MSKGPASIVVAFISGIGAFVLAKQNLKDYSLITKVAKEAEEIKSKILDDTGNADLYSFAENEISTNNINAGLWSQALVKANGNEDLRKVEYMKLRVKQLKNNDQKA